MSYELGKTCSQQSFEESLQALGDPPLEADEAAVTALSGSGPASCG
jgi:hypothetical protein